MVVLAVQPDVPQRWAVSIATTKKLTLHIFPFTLKAPRWQKWRRSANAAQLGGIAAGFLLWVGLGGGQGEGRVVGRPPLGKVALGHDAVDIWKGGITSRGEE